MSPRPKRFRKVSNPPLVSGFRPYGNKTEGKSNEQVFLHYEEYEAIRLCDHELLNQHHAAEFMEVSRPTLTRIYARARQKVADALVNGKQIIIEGGKVFFDSDWYHCADCSCYFNHPEKDITIEFCALCGSTSISNYDLESEMDSTFSGKLKFCECPQCGYEKETNRGQPCKTEKCPKCDIFLIRKGGNTNHSSYKKNYL